MEETPQDIECSIDLVYKPMIQSGNVNEQYILDFYIKRLVEQLGMQTLIVNLWQMSLNLDKEQVNGN